MRFGFTIIYNGMHHLEHNNWGCKLPTMLDYWVIVEGAANPGGSTNWCKEISNGDSSTDGTWSTTGELAGCRENVVCIGMAGRKWHSKDEMVNAAIKEIKDKYQSKMDQINCLWQFDIDEQWLPIQLNLAEILLIYSGADCGCFHANHYVGKNLIAKGTWGEGYDPDDPLRNAYRRLWRWKGQFFKTHEPPVLEGGNGKEILLPQRFDHYAYYFEKDVLFKSKYYKGYEDLHEKWLSLQNETKFPQPINRLLGGHWGETKTIIEKID